jgi:uncharacterized damage-inducible protein DinB
MSIPGVTGKELMAWVERTALGWQELIGAHPEALSFPCDIRETTSVAELLQHIVAVELRYAERLSGLAETPYEEIAFGSTEAIYTTHEKAMELVTQLDDREHAYWEEWVEFATRRGGSIRTTRRTVLVHLLMHSIRHYAQLATLLRQHGIAPNWQMDYLVMGVEAPKRS